jgi:cyclic pyranopterin phosphate synthase
VSAGPDGTPESGGGKSDRLTHIDSTGDARMVDVTAKPVSARQARATGFVEVSPRVVELLRGEGMPKGDALSVARIAGIMGAKRTPDLVPLCHPIAISGVKVALEVEDAGVAIAATVKTADRTGVEMEALTAVAVAGLTVIDMVKAVDPAAVLTRVRVEDKTGGVSGDRSRAG